jgi:hypothetical protein
MDVRSAQAVEARIMGRQKLRQAWHMQRHGVGHGTVTFDTLAGELGVDPGWIRDALNESASFGILVEQVERSQLESGHWGDRWPLIDIREAIWDLRCRLNVLRNQAPLPRLLKEIEPVEVRPLSAQVS